MTSTVQAPSALPPSTNMKTSFSSWQLFKLALGFVGIQFAWSMQIALSHKVLEPLGADPFLFGLIWCAGPVAGLLVQPIVGSISDKTWTPFGRRKPFILTGTLLGALGMLLFPFSSQLWMAASLIWLIDVAINTAQGPYRAVIPDIVPAKQTALANSFVNFAFGLGPIVALGINPLIHQLVGNELSMTQQYVLSAVALVGLVWLGLSNVQEKPPAPERVPPPPSLTETSVLNTLLESLSSGIATFKRAHPEIHKLCSAHFLIWIGVMSMFIYFTPYVAHHIYKLPDASTPVYKMHEQFYKLTTALPEQLTEVQLASLRQGVETLDSLRQEVTTTPSLMEAAQQKANNVLLTIYPQTDKLNALVEQLARYKEFGAIESATVGERQLELKLALAEYPLYELSQGQNDDSYVPKTLPLLEVLEEQSLFETLHAKAGLVSQLGLVCFNVTTILLTVPFALLSLRLGKRPTYSLSLMGMAVSFLFAPFVTTEWQAYAMMAGAGIGWATILSIPFAILSDYMKTGEEGSMLGMFNLFICLPQFVATLGVSQLISHAPILTELGATHNWALAFVVAGLSILGGVVALQYVKELPTPTMSSFQGLAFSLEEVPKASTSNTSEH